MARDIVKPFTRTVGRQQRRDVDVQREEIANGVHMRAIQPVEGRSSKIGARNRRPVEPCLELGCERIERGSFRTTGATRRHHAVLIFRTTFSHVSAFAATCEMSSMSSARSAVFIRWLWQVMQVLFEKSGLCTGNRTLPREWFRRLDRLKTAPLNCHRHEDDNEEVKAEVSSLKKIERLLT